MTSPDNSRADRCQAQTPAISKRRRSAWLPATRITLALATFAMLCTPAAAQDADLLALGRTIAETNCARCHAIGPEGSSTHPEAPAFRTLSDRYPIASLQEAFAEGIYVGHSDMPAFELDPADAEALLAYISSIQ